VQNGARAAAALALASALRLAPGTEALHAELLAAAKELLQPAAAGAVGAAPAGHASVQRPPPEPMSARALAAVAAEALEALALARGEERASVDVLFHLGAALQRVARWAGAVEAYERSLLLQPTLAAAELNLGRVLQQLGRGQEAEAHAQRALRLQPALLEGHK
jgi:tetratricopeptide (TPR) repeat protein